MPSSAKSIERYINHPVFGEGEVVDSRLHGLQLRVRFANGLSLWVSSHGLRVYERSREEIDQIAARRMTEAFRLGVVPHQDVERFTFGRQSETEMVEQALAALEKGSGGAYVIEGEYGAGKSHLLELIRHRAAEAGFVTAWCNLDPREVSPHRPKRVYRELVHSMRYFDHEAELSFRDILRKGVGLELDDHVFLSPVLKRLERFERTGVAAEVFWQWIEGESTKEYAAQPGHPYRLRGAQKIPALYDFSTAGDFYSYILSGLSYMMRKLGMKGLVLLIDEAESVTHLWNSLAVDRGVNFLEGLIRSAENDPRLKTIDERMVHNRVRTTPYIYKDSFITLFLATTPLVGEYSYVRMTGHAKKRIALNPLREADLHELFVRLSYIYRQAYPQFELSADWQERLVVTALKKKDEGVRFFIKYWVEGLDWLRWSK
jgi:hypothetical protein